MLSEEHVTQLSGAMVLLDLLDKVKRDGHETEELKGLHAELREWTDGVMRTLNEEEKNQAVDRYTEERSNGEIKTLPNLLAKFQR
jgi:hypothetical protein